MAVPGNLRNRLRKRIIPVGNTAECMVHWVYDS
jgi:hypothetical protein